jgi:hypothetical protein
VQSTRLPVLSLMSLRSLRTPSHPPLQSLYWLVLALALRTSESAFIGLTWRNVLRAAYPKSWLRFKTAWAASQGGTAINALTPPRRGPRR